MMKKKTMITLGVLGTVAIAFTVGVSVPIAMRNHETHYTVSIANADDARYVVSEMDTTQNKPMINTKKMVWDVPNKETEVVNAVAAYLERDTVHTIPTLNGTYTTKPYRNGFEKLIYDIMHTNSKHADFMTLVFPDVKVQFPKSMLDGTKVEKAEWLKSQTDAESLKFQAAVKSIQIAEVKDYATGADRNWPKADPVVRPIDNNIYNYVVDYFAK